jgi:hypothetical protein
LSSEQAVEWIAVMEGQRGNSGHVAKIDRELPKRIRGKLLGDESLDCSGQTQLAQTHLIAISQQLAKLSKQSLSGLAIAILAFVDRAGASSTHQRKACVS